MLKRVEYVVSENDIRSSLVRLTEVQDYIPATAYIDGGAAPDPANPPIGKAPISIDWGGVQTLHFVSAQHGHAPKPRNTAVVDLFARNGIVAGSRLAIEVLRAGELRITLI